MPFMTLLIILILLKQLISVQGGDSCGRSGRRETPQARMCRGGSRGHEKFEAARSAPTSIRQGRIEGAFCPQGDHGL